MKILLLFALLISILNPAWAEATFPFPTTEADIVTALTPKPISKRDRKGFGTEAYNLSLSEQRAQAVKDFLVSAYDIAGNRLRIQANGESQPIDSNDTEQGRMMNRRVEFVRSRE